LSIARVVALRPHALYCGMKSSVDEIRRRFDADVERFSNLETGQSSTVDAPLALELIVRTAAATTPAATHLLDVGAGAGNYTLKMLEALPGLDVTLVDLSRPMLDRAEARLRGSSARGVTTLQGDIRELALGESRFDLITAAAVLHHLRTDEEWEAVFTGFFRALRPGGSLWIFDLVEHTIPAVQAIMWRRYGEYLTALRDEAYRDHVFAYVEREDTPRPLLFQLDLLRRVGFTDVDVLHKNGCFAAFGAVKRTSPSRPQ
jgi:tRNA (cmo5U34)-methyltransferase